MRHERRLKADTKELITHAYGRLEGSVEGNANSLFWALDNWIHTSGTDVYFRFKDQKVEVQPTLSRGEWGATQDDAGRIYRNTNESALPVEFVPTPYFMRNPTLLRTRGSYASLEEENNDLNTVWPVRPNPGTNRAYQAGIDRTDGTLARFTAVCAPMVYRGDRLPAEPTATHSSRIPPATSSAVRAQRRWDDAAGAQGMRTRSSHRRTNVFGRCISERRMAPACRRLIAASSRPRSTTVLRPHHLAKLDQPTGLE
jgi:hypothetical protein